MATNRPLTVKELYRLCQKEIQKGHGDHVIMLSDDDEGNGYHYCWYDFTEPTEENGFDEYSLEDSLYRLDEEIAPLSETIILG